MFIIALVWACVMFPRLSSGTVIATGDTLPVTFSALEVTADQDMKFSVDVPYLDHTWKYAPELASIFDSISPGSVSSHPVLLTYLDFGSSTAGPAAVPRTSSDLGSCASLSPTAGPSGGEDYDQWLRAEMDTETHWTLSSHAGQNLFNASLAGPGPSGDQGYPIDSAEALSLMTDMTTLAWPAGGGGLVVGLEPFMDEGNRHMLRYHVQVSLADLMTCLSSANSTGTRRLAVGVTSSDNGTPGDETDDIHIYEFFPTVVFLEPVDILGQRGSFRAQSRQMRVTSNQYGYASQVAGYGRTLSVSLADVAALSGPAFGCSADYSDARVVMELDIMHTKDIVQDPDQIIGLSNLASVTTETGFVSCYDLPQTPSDTHWGAQSLDHWSLISARRQVEFVDHSLLLAGMDGCDPSADPSCVTNGAPFCPDGLTVCFQRLVLTSACLPLYEDGSTLDKSDVCFTQNASFPTNPNPSQFRLEQVVTACPNRTEWNDNSNLCTTYTDTPDILRITLTGLTMPPPITTEPTRIALEAQLLRTTETASFDDGLSSVTDFSSPEATTQASDLSGLASFTSDEFVTFATRPVNTEFHTTLPLAITEFRVCKGAISTLYDRAAVLAGTAIIDDQVSSPCGGVSDQVIFYQSQAATQDCDATNDQPCIVVEHLPKDVNLAMNPATYEPRTVSNFTVCSGTNACDAMAIKMSYIEDQVGILQANEVYMMEAVVYVGEYYNSPNRRRLLSDTFPMNDLLLASASLGQFFLSADVADQLDPIIHDETPSPTPGQDGTQSPSPSPSTTDPLATVEEIETVDQYLSDLHVLITHSMVSYGQTFEDEEETIEVYQLISLCSFAASIIIVMLDGCLYVIKKPISV